MGAYMAGSDPEINGAIRFATPVEVFLTQPKYERMTTAQSLAEPSWLLSDVGLDVPLSWPQSRH